MIYLYFIQKQYMQKKTFALDKKRGFCYNEDVWRCEERTERKGYEGWNSL